MKTEFKTKFLQHLQQKREDKGFTLIELLVVIIIIGILSAIALPAFLNQANKAKESEAKQTLSSINKAEQALYTQAGKFGSNAVCNDLGVAIKTLSSNYSFVCTTNTAGPGGSQANPITQAAASYRAYVGFVDLANLAGGETGTVSRVCQPAQPPAAGGPATIAFPATAPAAGGAACPAGTTEL